MPVICSWDGPSVKVYTILCWKAFMTNLTFGNRGYISSQLSSTLMTLVLVWLGHESWEKLSLLNSHQLLCNSCSRLSGAWELIKLSCKLSLLNSHATLVLVWPGHESWENSHANSRFSTLINSHVTLVLVCQGHESSENSHANSRFSTLINSHATLVLVWPGHESSENSHANSRFSTLINSHATLVLVWPDLYKHDLFQERLWV
jgi:hypothetical protein